MTATQHGLLPSDQRLADLDGDKVPDIAIGRIPARFADEADGYVAMLQQRESSAGSWTERALWLADDPDQGGEFPAHATELIAQLPASVTSTMVDRSRLAKPAARSELFAAIDDGVALFTYLGHGSTALLGSEGLLVPGDVAGLANGAARPVVAAITCDVGRTDFFGTGLAEALLFGANGGAAAVWSPTGLQYNEDGAALASPFLEAIEQGTLGEAVVESLRAWVQQGGDPHIALIYGLLGDPAMPVRPGATP